MIEISPVITVGSIIVLCTQLLILACLLYLVKVCVRAVSVLDQLSQAIKSVRNR